MESMKIKIFDFALIFTTWLYLCWNSLQQWQHADVLCFGISIKVGLCNHLDKIIKKCEQNIGRALPIFTWPFSF